MEKLELFLETAMPCKAKNIQYREICGESDNRKSKHACIVEAHESTRSRLERTLPKDHEGRTEGNVFESLQSCEQVYSYASSTAKSRMQKQRWTRNGKKGRKFRRGT